MTVKILHIDRGFSLWVWLCRFHTNQRRKEGWAVKDQKKAPHELPCDDAWKGRCS